MEWNRNREDPMYRYLLLVALLLSISVPCFGAAGDLDSSFSQDGKVTTSFGTAYNAFAYDMFIQPDGKIVAVGTVQKASNPGKSGLALARYNSDGSLDTTFGNSGKRSTFFTSQSALGFTAVLQNTNIL